MSHHLSQAGNKIHGTFQNHGVQLNGNNFSVGGNFTINTGITERDRENECRRALRQGCTDPVDDRAKIISLKGRIITATCDWITEHSRYKTWRNIRTRSQLLWVSGGQARGKTMLAIFLSQEFDRLSRHAEQITVLYYFCDRQDKRDTAVHVLRGLIERLTSVRKELIRHLLEEYDVQKDSLFTANSIESLWRVFEKMVRDPAAGQVYCIVDGLDICAEESLRRLMGRIRDFFLDEPQVVVDEGMTEGDRTSKRPGQKVGAGFKMMLVSREEPDWLLEHLSGFPRVQIGGTSKKDNKAALASAKPTSAKAAKKAPKLADIAASIIRKQTLDKTEKERLAAEAPPKNPSHGFGYNLLDAPEQNPSFAAATPVSMLHGSPYTTEPDEYVYEMGATAAAEVDQEDTDVGEDDDSYDPSLRLYIEAKVEDVAAEKQYTTAMQSFICAGLEHRGDGTFLWVDFAVEELRRTTIDNVENMVNSLPQGLDEMYMGILLGVPPHLADLVAGLLRWTVCARRPLDLFELTVALNLSHYNLTDGVAYIMTAVAACGSMLAIEEEKKTVNIVHSSLTDLLTGDTSPILLDARLSRYHIRPAEMERDIAHFCISYLEQGCMEQSSICHFENEAVYNQRVTQFPFTPYACSYWPDHLRDAINPYLDLSSPFFQAKSKARKHWWLTYYAYSTGKGTFMAPRNFTLLHLAAYLDLAPLAQQMYQRGELQSRLDKKDAHGSTPLDYTVALGHVSMFRFLIQCGAKQEPVGETLLELACRKGQREIVALLIDMGYDVNARSQPMTPMSSLFTMTRWLPGALNEGLYLDRDTWSMIFRDVGVQETPLHDAATYGHSSVIELLLERGAVIDAGTTKGFTPLHSASYTGQTECVQLLIDRGATINAVTTDVWLPMHYAAMRGKLPVVELFLDLGIPIDSLTIKAKSALHFASYSGHADVVRRLVERGANMELRSYKGETPLHLATRHTKPQVIELLLSLGASRFATTNEGHTALQMAQASTLVGAKECLSILQTYGTPGYQPWQPPQVPNGTAATTTGTATTTEGTANADSAARRHSAASTTTSRSAGHTPVSRANTVQGFQASISVQVQPPPANGYAPSQLAQPFQSAATSSFPTAPPYFNRMQSDPTPTPSKFSYDPMATMQQYPGQENGIYGSSMSTPSEPPPSYMASVGNPGYTPPTTFPEKSPAFTSQMNRTSQTAWQPSSTMHAPVPTPQSYVQQQVSPDPTRGGTPQVITTSPPTTVSPQAEPSSMIQMLNSLSISRAPSSPAPTPQLSQPAVSTIVYASPAPGPSPTPQIQTYQNPQQQTSYGPVSPLAPTPTMQIPYCPTMLPYQPTLTPQPPLTSPMQPIQQYQTASTPIPQTPMSATTPFPPQSQPQYLNPMSPPPQVVQSVQSPQFSGNSTANTYNASYEYSAPAVMTPYIPNVGPTGNAGWQGNANAGIMFAPPPTAMLQKKKSFLGGYMGN